MEILLIIMLAPLALALGVVILGAVGTVSLGVLGIFGDVVDKTGDVVEQVTPWGWYCLTLGFTIWLLIATLTGCVR